jgi:hypothetical protein
VQSRLQLIPLLGLATIVYLPHLAEEALTKMHDDPLIVSALAPLSQLSPRHAAYLVFQTMLALTLMTTFAFGKGGKWRLVVMAVIAVSLLAEGHHLVRAAMTLRYNSGLVTSLPMPALGAYLLYRVTRAWNAAVPRSLRTLALD